MRNGSRSMRGAPQARSGTRARAAARRRREASSRVRARTRTRLGDITESGAARCIMKTDRAMKAAWIVLVAATALVLVGGATVTGATDNKPGTIKVHDNATADPEVRNEPHVSCDFWVEGFNMEDSSGTLTFQAWPPTGSKEVVTPTGDDLEWTADSGNGHGNFHFLSGAYQLPEGHYKVTSSDGDEKEKSKVFWVDPCAPPPACTG